jgi:hypothetical protein
MGWAKSGSTWLADYAIENWPSIIVAISGFGGMTYLASISEWLKPYGAVAWGAVGILTILVICVCYAVYGWARERLAHVQFMNERAKTVDINPLAGHFSKLRIQLSDFYNPFYIPTENAKFEDCELLGPSTIALLGNGTFHGVHFIDCEAVIVKIGTNINGATAFKTCIFERCKFFRVTFYLSKEQHLHMVTNLGQAFPIISDGTAGDL